MRHIEKISYRFSSVVLLDSGMIRESLLIRAQTGVLSENVITAAGSLNGGGCDGVFLEGNEWIFGIDSLAENDEVTVTVEPLNSDVLLGVFIPAPDGQHVSCVNRGGSGEAECIHFNAGDFGTGGFHIAVANVGETAGSYVLTVSSGNSLSPLSIIPSETGCNFLSCQEGENGNAC